MTGRRRARPIVLAAVMVALITACGSTPSGTGPAAGSAAPSPAAGDPAVVGAVALEPVTLPADADAGLEADRVDLVDVERLRDAAGFATAVGTGWGAMSSATDDAVDGVVAALSTELGIDLPVAGRAPRLASVVDPGPPARSAADSAASAMALVTAASIGAAALGQAGSRDVSRSDTRTVTDGDDVATVSITASGTVTATGSRVVAEITFELTGDVRNTVTGATARMTGTATARVEIDGCPDENGASKGTVSLSSTESVSGADPSAGIAGWTRDLTGSFDIRVDDEASIAGLALDANASEAVTGTAGDDANQDHELEVRAHWEYGGGRGFGGMSYDPGASSGELVRENGATAADVAPLMRSAASSIGNAAILLGDAAESFWRGGKCIEVIVDPEGGDVDAESVTEVVATVRHRFEGTELDKPVEATLAGVAAIDPPDGEQPAPATVRYTAGSEDGETGTITFMTTSNRGIGETAVTFTVNPSAWIVTFEGTDKEVFGPVANTFDATVQDLRVSVADDVLSGTGTLRLQGTVRSGMCAGELDQVSPVRVTGALAGAGTEAVLRMTLGIVSPPGDIVTLACPGLKQDLPAEGHAERFGEALGAIDLPVAGGTVTVNESTAIGGIVQVTIKGTFTVVQDGS